MTNKVYLKDIQLITSDDVPTKTSDLTNDGSDGNDTYVESGDLATVATTGSYADLSSVPAIPAVTNSVVWYGSSSTAAGTRVKNVAINGFTASDLTAGTVFVIQFKYGNTVSNVEFSINQGIASGNVYAQTGNVSAAHKWVSDETVTFIYDGTAFIMCDGGIATTTYYGATKLSSSYSSSSDSLAATPSAVKAAYDHATDANTAVTNLSNSLATVATSGSYADLSNKPTIPTATSDLTNDSGFIAEDANGDVSIARNINAGGDVYADGRVVLDDNIYNVLTTSTTTSAPSQDKFQPFGRVTHDLATTEEIHLAEFGSVKRATGESQIYLQAANEQNGTRTTHMLFLGVDANGGATVTLHRSAWLNALGLAPLLKTTTQQINVPSTAKGANFSDSFAISNPPSGYVCLGIIQWDWVSGTRQNWFNNYGIWANKTTIYVKLCNMNTSGAASGVLEVCLLWAKTDNTSHYAD